jgi:hypothetical protein
MDRSHATVRANSLLTQTKQRGVVENVVLEYLIVFLVLLVANHLTAFQGSSDRSQKIRSQ